MKTRVMGKTILGIFVMIGGILLMVLGVLVIYNVVFVGVERPKMWGGGIYLFFLGFVLTVTFGGGLLVMQKGYGYIQTRWEEKPKVFSRKSLIKRMRADSRRKWEAKLRETDTETRTLFQELIKRLESELPKITHHEAHGTYQFFKRKKVGRFKHKAEEFAIILPNFLEKGELRIEIGVNSFFKDRLNITKKKDWVMSRFGGRARRVFSIGKPDQLDYAVELMKQSHDST